MTTKRRVDGRDCMSSIASEHSVGEAAVCLAQSRSGLQPVRDDKGRAGGNVTGLSTGRDICRAVASQGTVVGDLSVRVIASHEFPKLDIAASPRDRLQAFSERKTNHFVLRDGAAVSGILNVWDCAEAHVRGTEARPA